MRTSDPHAPPKKGRALKKGEIPQAVGKKTMAKAGRRDPVQIWTTRLLRGKKDYEWWAKEYQVDRCAKYYLGKHWHGLAVDLASKKYAINMVFSTVETQLPSLLFSRPKVDVEPKPSRAQAPGSDAGGRATLIASMLQTFVDDRDVHFTYETTLALRDAYPRFGVIEVGYTADWIDNPNADKPVLKENSEDALHGEDGEPVLQPKKVLKPGSKEQLFLKRLPPQACRVGPGRNQLLSNDWFAYYEWHYVDDVKANPEYQHTDDLQATGTVSTDEDEPGNDPDGKKHEGQVKLWKIWDLRKKVRHVLAEGADQLLQENKAYQYLPLAVLKFYEIADSFYPLPPIYNWLSPQDEINETREGQRTHRRRFVRRYMREPIVQKSEFEKLETGEDGVCIEVAKVNPSPIMPIPDADLSAQNTVQELALSKDDFQQVAGVSGEARGVPQSDTATQANIINVREQIRESRARSLVAEWLGEIVRLMLLTIKDKMQGPMVVKMTVDPFHPAPSAVQQTESEWREVQAEQLGDLDVDVKIDVASLSPVAEQAQQQSWSVVLQLLKDPALMALLMTPNPEAPTEPSPLLRKTLSLYGVKSDQEVREIWRIGQAALKQAAQTEALKNQQANQPDPPSISLALKGDDMKDPIIGPLIVAMFAQAEGLQALAKQVEALLAQQPAPAPPAAGSSSGAIPPLTSPTPGPATGVPAPGPMTG